MSAVATCFKIIDQGGIPALSMQDSLQSLLQVTNGSFDYFDYFIIAYECIEVLESVTLAEVE